MTIVRYRGRKGERVIASPSFPSSPASTPMTRINEQNLRKKLNRSMQQKRVEPPVRSTARLGEIKRDKTPGQDRIERLAAIGRQYGAEFLEHEITVLERKIADLRAAVKLVDK